MRSLARVSQHGGSARERKYAKTEDRCGIPECPSGVCSHLPTYLRTSVAALQLQGSQLYHLCDHSISTRPVEDIHSMPVSLALLGFAWVILVWGFSLPECVQGQHWVFHTHQKTTTSLIPLVCLFRLAGTQLKLPFCYTLYPPLPQGLPVYTSFTSEGSFQNTMEVSLPILGSWKPRGMALVGLAALGFLQTCRWQPSTCVPFSQGHQSDWIRACPLGLI